MRLHTDTLTHDDLDNAARVAGVRLIKANDHGSRKRDHAFDVALSGRGVMGGMYGNLGYATATWDEWGMFLAALYRVDSELVAGPYLHNREDDYDSFDFLTGDRYITLKPSEQHLRHRWTFEGRERTYGFMPGMAAMCSERSCRCGAVRRWVTDRVKAEKTATVTGTAGRFSTARQSHDARAWTASGDVD